MSKQSIITVFLSVGLTAALASCGGNGKSTTLIPSGNEAPAIETAQQEETNMASPEIIEARVNAIYDAVAAAYPELHEIPPSTDSLDIAFCSAQWQTLVEMVNNKDSEEMGEERFFTSDYWIMGQDYGKISIDDVKVELKDDNNHANVSLILHNLSDIKVKLEMVFENGEWKIDNFIDQSKNLNWKENMIKHLEKKSKQPNQTIGEDIIEYNN